MGEQGSDHPGRRRRPRRAAAVACAALATLLLSAPRAGAVDPDHAITQYGHTSWSVRGGFFTGTPDAVTQTRDGFLWIGTSSGLLRFDGVRFTPWQPPAGSRLPDEAIINLLATSDGSLWIGTGHGLARWHDGQLSVYARVGRFGGLAEDRQGAVWVGHTRALALLPPLGRFQHGEMRWFRFADGDGPGYIGSLLVDRRGTLWLGGDRGACRLRPESPDHPECHDIAGLAGMVGKSAIFALADDADGTLWATGAPAGVWRLAPSGWQAFPGVANAPIEAATLLGDRAGSVWIGSHGGLIRRAHGRTDRFTRADGLSGDLVSAAFEDREGTLWVATSGGLDRFRDLKVTTLTAREGLPGDPIAAVAAAGDGGLWISAWYALVHYDRSGMTAYDAAHGLPGSGPNGLLEDSHGRLWVGIDDGLAWLEHGRFFRFAMPDGTAVGLVSSMAEDRDGGIWITTTNPQHALLHLLGGRLAAVFSTVRLGMATNVSVVADPSGGIWFNDGISLSFLSDGRTRAFGHVTGDPVTKPIHGMLADARGLWLATKQGLILLRHGGRLTLDRRHGLACDDLLDAVGGNDGSLWLKSSCGLAQIAAADLDAWAVHPERRVHPRVLDALDGVLGSLSPHLPHSVRTRDGRLWFALEDAGLQEIDPSKLHDNGVPPPVEILGVVADHRSYPMAARLRLPPLTRELEIDYTALSLAVPEKVRFRYRLEGVEREWQEAGTRREAFYTNLGPGTYRFRVVACNNDGVWNPTGAMLSVAILPAFYQTRTFLVLAAAACLGLVGAAYRWRLREVRASLGRRFQERLAERMRIAQELHDTLLQGFLSASMQLHAAVEELPADTPVKPRLHRVQQLMGQVIDEGRNALHGLRAQSGGGDDLGQALARTRQELGAPEELGFQVIVQGRPRPLAPIIRDEVYRIGREALANAFRHAGASAVEVELEFAPKALRLAVRDDGRGIDPQVLRTGREGHFGMPGMRERAERIGGRLEVWSRAGAGTEVELSVPGRVAFQGEPAVGAGWRSARPWKTWKWPLGGRRRNGG